MFIDRSELLQGNTERLHYGVCVTDIDGDGNFEWFIAGFGSANRAYKWTGSDYQDIAPRALADSRRQAIGLAACDIDGNGREEIYVLNTDSFGGAKRIADRLFAFGDDWVDLFELPQNQDALNLTAGRSVVAIDRNGDGLYGLFVANYGGPMRLYELDDDGILRDVAPEAQLDLVTGGRGLVALPIVSDHMDIFAGNEHGPNFLFRNKGDGTFEEIAAQLGIGDPFEHVRGIAALDTNGDGRFDLVYGNWEGPHRMFVQSSDGIWDDIAPPEMAQPSRIRTVIAADFDNDGYEELFFNNIGEPNRLFALHDGEWQSIPLGDAIEPEGLGTGAAVADIDGDGRLELLISHGESSPQPISLYHTAPNSNHYLRVLPLTRYDAPARGAMVTLQTSTRTQRRAIDAGSGYLCQMEPVAHFGLGQEDSVEHITIHWPDGITHRIDHPTIDQLLRVPYPTE